MLTVDQLKKRRPVWEALSELYVDNALLDNDHKTIAKRLVESGYKWAEIETINKYEVFPVLQSNLLHAAGGWSGYNTDWLNECIENALSNSYPKELRTKVTFFLYGYMVKEELLKTKKHFIEFKKLLKAKKVKKISI